MSAWHDQLLVLCLCAPLVGALVLMTFPVGAAGQRGLALVIAVAELALGGSLAGWVTLSSATPQLVVLRPWIDSLGISFALGIDGFGLLLVLLTMLLTILAIIASPAALSARRGYLACLLVLEASAIGVLTALDLVLLAACWELATLAIVACLALWGEEAPARAALRFLVYALAGSFPFLVAVLTIGLSAPEQAAHPFLLPIAGHPGHAPLLPRALQEPLFIALAAPFLVRLAIAPGHAWLAGLLRAVPSGASILIVGLLAALGLAGLQRVALALVPAGAFTWLPIIAALGLFSLVHGALVALAACDVNSGLSAALSALGGLILIGVASLSVEGLAGAGYLAVGQGLALAALLFTLGAVRARLGPDAPLSQASGLGQIMPQHAALTFASSLAVVALPCSAGFIGVFLIVSGALLSPLSTTITTIGGVARGWALLTVLVVCAAALAFAWWLLRLYQRERLSGLLLGAGLTLAGGLAWLLLRGWPLWEHGLLLDPIVPWLTVAGPFRRLLALIGVAAAAGALLAAIPLVVGVPRLLFGPLRLPAPGPIPDSTPGERAFVISLLLTIVVLGLHPQPALSRLEPAAAATVNHVLVAGAGQP